MPHNWLTLSTDTLPVDTPGNATSCENSEFEFTAKNGRASTGKSVELAWKCVPLPPRKKPLISSPSSWYMSSQQPAVRRKPDVPPPLMPSPPKSVRVLG